LEIVFFEAVVFELSFVKCRVTGTNSRWYLQV